MLRCEMMNTFPYTAVGRLDFVDPRGEKGWCSGALIDTTIIVTAAHCLYSPINGTDGWIQVRGL